MRTLATAVLFATTLSFAFGCAGVSLTDDDGDIRSGGQALEVSTEDCKAQCKDEFHECRQSPERGGGPGASACAHQKNDCEKSC